MLTDASLFHGLIVGWFILAVIAFVFLLFVSAPYGRHSRRGWGATMSDRLGWIIMESPAPLIFALCFAFGQRRGSLLGWVFLLAWQAHYFHRAFIYPLRLRTRNGHMPAAVVASGCVFNAVNAYLNGRCLFTFADEYPALWLSDPRFLAGAALFIAGYAVNRHADAVLRGLRAPGEGGYRIPCGGPVSMDLVPELSGRDHYLVRMGIGDLVTAGPGFRSVEHRQSRTACPLTSPLVCETVSRIPTGAPGVTAWSLVAWKDTKFPVRREWCTMRSEQRLDH